jgi:hypothetical protein
LQRVSLYSGGVGEDVFTPKMHESMYKVSHTRNHQFWLILVASRSLLRKMQTGNPRQSKCLCKVCQVVHEYGLINSRVFLIL